MAAELVHALLGTSAELLPDGRFSVLGAGIDGIVVAEFPATIPSLALIARVRFGYDDLDHEHEFEVRAKRPDDAALGLAARVSSARNAHFGPRIGPYRHGVMINIHVAIVNVTLELPGVYLFEFVVNNEIIGNLEVPAILLAELETREV